MQRIVTGNILEADAQALVNTVNTVGIMGKGIALQFKKAFPAMFDEYVKICKNKKLEPGQMHVFDRGSMFNPRYIINFPTKRHWKGKSKLVDIVAGLDGLVEELRIRHIRSVAIPPLGCGNGGLNWNDVRPLIERALDRVPNVDALIFAPSGAPAPSDIVNRTERPIMTPSRASMIRLLSDYCVLGYELTLLEIQKILYFLQAAGEPLKLKFTKKQYGPYADNLRHVLHKFEGHFLQGVGDGLNSPQTPIQLFQDAVAEAVLISEQRSTPEQSGRMRKVFDLIEGFESPYGMELLASVHWVATQEVAKNDPESVTQALQVWNPRKRDIMKPEHVAIAWNRLQELGWFDQDALVSDDRQ
jgi:O-acetyl-ADP-ribose deacetylase (regulator of RNase III)